MYSKDIGQQEKHNSIVADIFLKQSTAWRPKPLRELKTNVLYYKLLLIFAFDQIYFERWPADTSVVLTHLQTSLAQATSKTPKNSSKYTG